MTQGKLKLKRTKNGNTIFEDSLKVRYENPYIKYPPLFEKLQTFIDEGNPEISGNSVIEYLEDENKPLVSQNLQNNPKDKQFTTGKVWMPTGNALLEFSSSINKNL